MTVDKTKSSQKWEWYQRKLFFIQPGTALYRPTSLLDVAFTMQQNLKEENVSFRLLNSVAARLNSWMELARKVGSGLDYGFSDDTKFQPARSVWASLGICIFTKLTAVERQKSTIRSWRTFWGRVVQPSYHLRLVWQKFYFMSQLFWKCMRCLLSNFFSNFQKTAVDYTATTKILLPNFPVSIPVLWEFEGGYPAKHLPLATRRFELSFL